MLSAIGDFKVWNNSEDAKACKTFIKTILTGHIKYMKSMTGNLK